MVMMSRTSRDGGRLAGRGRVRMQSASRPPASPSQVVPFRLPVTSIMRIT
jgi:hypothetical protein